MKSPLIKKIVRLEPIFRKGGWLQDIDKNHDGAFMFTGSFLRLKGLPVSSTSGEKPQILDADEIAWYESPECPLGLKPGDLSPHKMEKNFWTKFEVKIPKDGLTLDLNNMHDFLKYKFLCAYENLICPSPDKVYENMEYKFTFTDDNYVIETTNKRGDIQKELWKEFGKIEDSIDKLRDFLLLYGRKAPVAVKHDWLKSEVTKIIESDPKRFLEIVKDKNSTDKLFIEKGIACGAIRKEKTTYKLPGGDIIGRNIDEAIMFLKDKINSDIYATIKAHIEQ